MERELLNAAGAGGRWCRPASGPTSRAGAVVVEREWSWQRMVAQACQRGPPAELALWWWRGSGGESYGALSVAQACYMVEEEEWKRELQSPVSVACLVGGHRQSCGGGGGGERC